jgi:hypothetical protein
MNLVTQETGLSIAIQRLKYFCTLNITFHVAIGIAEIITDNAKKNSVALVRKQTIQTERPPHVGEVSTKFTDEGIEWSAQRIPTAVNPGFLYRRRYFSFK